jgi:Family of unknown function (DUF5681)
MDAKQRKQQRKQQMPFQKGQSGNPLGRPPGARSKATLIAESLLQGEAEAMTRLAIEPAKAGDMAALPMCLDRLAPPCRRRTIEFELPRLASAEDAGSALAAITAAVGAARGSWRAVQAGRMLRAPAGGNDFRATACEAGTCGRKIETAPPQINQICQVGENNHGAES